VGSDMTLLLFRSGVRPPLDRRTGDRRVAAITGSEAGSRKLA